MAKKVIMAGQVMRRFADGGHMKVARRAAGAGLRKPPMEETAGGGAKPRVRR